MKKKSKGKKMIGIGFVRKGRLRAKGPKKQPPMIIRSSSAFLNNPDPSNN